MTGTQKPTNPGNLKDWHVLNYLPTVCRALKTWMERRHRGLISQRETRMNSLTAPFIWQQNPIFATSDEVNENGRVGWYHHKEHSLSKIEINFWKNVNHCGDNAYFKDMRCLGSSTMYNFSYITCSIKEHILNVKAFCDVNLKKITRACWCKKCQQIRWAPQKELQEEANL